MIGPVDEPEVKAARRRVILKNLREKVIEDTGSEKLADQAVSEMQNTLAFGDLIRGLFSRQYK